MEIKKNIPNNTITRKLVDLDRETGNVYKSINIIARRANQISTELKTELNRKLADFSSPTDTMEETFENRRADRDFALLRTPAQTVIIATGGVPRPRAGLQGGQGRRDEGDLKSARNGIPGHVSPAGGTPHTAGYHG